MRITKSLPLNDFIVVLVCLKKVCRDPGPPGAVSEMSKAGESLSSWSVAKDLEWGRKFVNGICGTNSPCPPWWVWRHFGTSNVSI